jgi:hypothetical protein
MLAEREPPAERVSREMTSAAKLLTEAVVSLSQAARTLPSLRAGRPTHPSTLWRWAHHGISTPVGVIRLETAHLAGRVVTSREAVTRFLTAVANARADAGPTPPSNNQPTPDPSTHEADKAKLDRFRL